MENLNRAELQSMWGLLLGERRGLSASGGSTFLIDAEIKQVTELLKQAIANEA